MSPGMCPPLVLVASSDMNQLPPQCETSMASTFDPELVHQVGELLAEEAKVKSSVILLAPTCNIQRNPLGGRAFESFSEDPHLSGTSPYFRL